MAAAVPALHLGGQSVEYFDLSPDFVMGGGNFFQGVIEVLEAA